MKNVTIVMDDEVARWARVRAAEEDQSLSRWIGDFLARERRKDAIYESAKSAFLGLSPRALRSSETKYPSRDELHDRNGLR